jgi:hypothetical protein
MLICGRDCDTGLSAQKNKSLERTASIVKDSEAKIALATAEIQRDIQRKFTSETAMKDFQWLATDTIENLSWQFLSLPLLVPGPSNSRPWNNLPKNLHPVAFAWKPSLSALKLVKSHRYKFQHLGQCRPPVSPGMAALPNAELMRDLFFAHGNMEQAIAFI